MSFATMVRDSQPERALRLAAIAKARRLVARRLKHHPSDLRILRARLTAAARSAREMPIEHLGLVDELVLETMAYARAAR